MKRAREVDDDEETKTWQRRSRPIDEIRDDCPYLDTVNRLVLDFDFENFCSVSLSNLNVCACLVVGNISREKDQNLMHILIVLKLATMSTLIYSPRNYTIFAMDMK